MDPAVDVVWLSYHQEEGIIPRGYWDQGLLEDMMARRTWRPASPLRFVHHETDYVPELDGAIVVLPARHHRNDVQLLNGDIAKLRWCVLILTGDEANEFPWRGLDHPNMRTWLTHPVPGEDRPETVTRLIGSFYSPGTPERAATFDSEAATRPLDWAFAGQVTHGRRQTMVEFLREMHKGELVETPGFTQGVDPDEYMRMLCSAKVAPSPGGPESPDSFRVYEALEAGCMPIVDEHMRGYWEELHPANPLFIVDSWSNVEARVGSAVQRWPANANRATTWWQSYKRELVCQLEDDVASVRGSRPESSSLADVVTVVMTTSPCPTNPSTHIIDETLDSIGARAYPALDGCEVLIGIDLPRPEFSDRRGQYEEYIRRLSWECAHHRYNVLPVPMPKWLHQANTTRHILEMVRTPIVLFMEHDTPVQGEVPWGDLCDLLLDGHLDVVRLSHEGALPESHWELMIDHVGYEDRPKRVEIGDASVPVYRTVQWSQRPHLATTAYYRDVIDRNFHPEARTMIEDVMYGVCRNAIITDGVTGWYRNRIGIYAPDGDMRRSGHLDARGDDPKFDMRFVYVGKPPPGAPAATDSGTRPLS